MGGLAHKRERFCAFVPEDKSENICEVIQLTISPLGSNNGTYGLMAHQVAANWVLAVLDVLDFCHCDLT